MALRDQPYLPLYVQDFLTDEKLSECSAESTGVYIRLMCLMHKSETYGTILLKQKDKQNSKQNDKQILDFAIKLARQMPYDTDTIERALTELLEEKVIGVEGDVLYQKRMVHDGKLSNTRASAGSKGGKKKANQNFASEFATGFASDFAIAKSVANTEYENENEIDNESVGDIGNLPDKKEPTSRVREDRKAEIKKIWDSYDFSPELSKAVKGWGKYKSEKGQGYKPEGLKTLLSTIRNRAAEYGEAAVISVIAESMSSNYQGIMWDKIKNSPAGKGKAETSKKSFTEIIAARNGGGT